MSYQELLLILMYSKFMFRNLHPVKHRFSHTMIPYDVYETVYVPHLSTATMTCRKGKAMLGYMHPCACDSSRPKFQYMVTQIYIYIYAYSDASTYAQTSSYHLPILTNYIYICRVLVICICDFCRGVHAIIDVVLLMFSVKLLGQCEPLMTTFQQGSTSVEFGCIHGVDLSPLELLQFSCIFMWNIMKTYSIHLVAFSVPATCCVCRNR